MSSSETRPILVFGKNGQLARGLRDVFPTAVFKARAECDLADPTRVLACLNEVKPGLILNAAAFTEVDRAEADFATAELINAVAPGEIANWCRKNQASLVHFSTDYVYGGEGTQALRENDLAAPSNRYGRSKLNGEIAIAQSDCHHLILRTSWLFSLYGNNFLTTMIRLGTTQEKLRVVEDQVGAPTSVFDLAAATRLITRHPNFKSSRGIFNLVNHGETSWYGFTNEIFKRLRAAGLSLKVKAVEPITSEELNRPAQRPRNSRLNTEKVKEHFGVQLRAWDEALAECLSGLPLQPESVFS